MAGMYISYNCGCGFHTTSLEAAVKHSDERDHTLTVLGEIRATKPKKERATQEPRRAVPIDREAITSAATDFGALRAKLSKKE